MEGVDSPRRQGDSRSMPSLPSLPPPICPSPSAVPPPLRPFVVWHSVTGCCMPSLPSLPPPICPFPSAVPPLAWPPPALIKLAHGEVWCHMAWSMRGEGEGSGPCMHLSRGSAAATPCGRCHVKQSRRGLRAIPPASHPPAWPACPPQQTSCSTCFGPSSIQLLLCTAQLPLPHHAPRGKLF